MGDSSQMNPHSSPRQSLPSTISNHHPYQILDIQSNQGSDTGLAPPASRLPPIQLSDHPVQPASSDFPSPSVGTPTSSHLAAEEQLTCPFSHSPFTLSPPAESQSLSLNQWSHVISSSSSTSSESSSASETDVDMPVGVPSQPRFGQPTDTKDPAWLKERS